MAVLCEGTSVVIKKQSIESRYEGGFNAFLSSVPNQSLCDDGELIRVGFMNPDHVKEYIDELVEANLRFQRVSISGLLNETDIAVVDQQMGLTIDCDWLLVGHIPINPVGDLVTGCWLEKSTSKQLALPDDWNYENSLSRKFHFSKTENIDKDLKFLRSEANLDVYLNLKLGIEVFIAKK